jgi:hypothetical protein
MESADISAIDCLIERLSNQEQKLDAIVEHLRSQIVLHPRVRSPGVLFGIPWTAISTTDPLQTDQVTNFRISVTFPFSIDSDTIIPPKLWTAVGVCGPGVDGFRENAAWKSGVIKRFQDFVEHHMKEDYTFLKRDIVQSVNHVRVHQRYNWEITKATKYATTKGCVDTNIVAHLFGEFICERRAEVYYCEFVDGRMIVVIRDTSVLEACGIVSDILKSTLSVALSGGFHIEITPVYDGRLLPFLRMFDIYEPDKKLCGKQVRATLRQYGEESRHGMYIFSERATNKDIMKELQKFVRLCFDAAEA